MSSVFEMPDIFCRYEPAKMPPIAAGENLRLGPQAHKINHVSNAADAPHGFLGI
jgi:hypothetical protein